MKKLYLYLTLFLFIAISAFAGEYIIGGGFFDPGGAGVGGNGPEYYEMDASGGSVVVTGLTGQAFAYTGTTRTYIDGNGVMQDAAINTPRVETKGLLLEPEGANIALQSRNFDTSPWADYGTPTLSQNRPGVDGTANKAFTIGDDNSGAIEGIHQDFPISANNPTATFSVFVEKGGGTGGVPNLKMVWKGVSTQTTYVQFNSATGATNVNSGTGNGVAVAADYGDFYRFSLTDTDISNNTTLEVAINPGAHNLWGFSEVTLATGTEVIDSAQVEINHKTEKPWQTSYVDGDGVAAGSDLATDGDCSAGTLTTGAGWAHDPTNDEYDATTSEADLTDPGILTANKVYRIKTVWGNITGGSVRVAAGLPIARYGQDINADGTYYDYLVSTGADLGFDAAFSFTGSLQSYEVLEYGTARVTEQEVFTYDLPSGLFLETLGAEEYDTIFTNYAGDTGYETYTTSGLDVTLADNTTSLGICYDNIVLDPLKVYKITFDYTLVSGIEPYYRFSGNAALSTGLRLSEQMSGTGSYTFYSLGTDYHGFRLGTSDVGSFSVANLSIKEVTSGGTAIVWWRPGYDRADALQDSTIEAAAWSNLLYHSTAGFPRSYDGTNTASASLDYSKDTPYKLILKWGYLTSNVRKFRLGYDSGSGVTWGTESNFDGNFITSPNLTFGVTLSAPQHNKRTRIYREILTDEEIDATPAP